jgi:uncharacterized membrane protein YhaH (DUF805 family)
MTFTAAVRSCLAQYARFTGRASRAEFWCFSMFLAGVLATAAIGDVALDSWYLTWLAALALVVPFYAATIRRLYDSGKSGWITLLYLSGVGSVVLLFLLLADGEPHRNEHGEPQLSPDAARLAAETAAFHARQPM